MNSSSELSNSEFQMKLFRIYFSKSEFGLIARLLEKRSEKKYNSYFKKLN